VTKIVEKNRNFLHGLINDCKKTWQRNANGQIHFKGEMNMAIKLYQSQTSMFCEKVRVVLALKRMPYEIVDVRQDDRKSLI